MRDAKELSTCRVVVGKWNPSKYRGEKMCEHQVLLAWQHQDDVSVSLKGLRIGPHQTDQRDEKRTTATVLSTFIRNTRNKYSTSS